MFVKRGIIVTNSVKNLDAEVATNVEQCNTRLQEILQTKKAVYWANILGVTKSVISARWKRDSLPNIPNVIKLLMISGCSANWLLFGIGPKYLQDAFDDKDVAENEKKRRRETEIFLKLEKDLYEAERKIAELRTFIEMHQEVEWLKTAAEDQLFLKSAEEIKQYTGKSIFRKMILPLLTIMQSLNLVGFKFMEKLALSENGGRRIATLFESLHKDLEKNQFATLSSLAGLDDQFKTVSITDPDD